MCPEDQSFSWKEALVLILITLDGIVAFVSMLVYALHLYEAKEMVSACTLFEMAYQYPSTILWLTAFYYYSIEMYQKKF